MRHRRVTSRMLASVGYDEATATLEVVFVAGGMYRYFRVPREVYLGLMAAASHGAYFEAKVKQGGYRYTRIG